MTEDEKALEAKKSAFFEKLPDPPAAPPPAEEAGDEPDPKADADGVAELASTTKDAQAPSTESPGTSTTIERVVAALKAGDLDALADLTEQDPAMFDEKTTKWAARNRREAKLKAEVAQVRADASAILDHYAPVDEKLEKFQKTRDYAVAVELFELLTGEAWAEVVAKVESSRGARATDHRRPAPASAKALAEAVRDDIPEDHQVRALPEWESMVVAVLQESAAENDGEPELSFRQAAARVVRREKERHTKLAKVFGGAAEGRPAKTPAPERASGSTPATKRKLTREEFFAAFAK